MNQKSVLGLNSCFLDLNDPIQLFKAWMDEASKTELNDPNALSLSTTDKNGTPSVRIVLLKDFGKDGFTFYTNLESPKSLDLGHNPKAAMCFHWKSLQRQVRVSGSINKVADETADKYFSSRDYNSKIGAWASEQSKVLQNRSDLYERIDGFKKIYPKTGNVPRPENWSGWILKPTMIEFWLGGPSRIHERLRYYKKLNNWVKKLLNP
jgi:pyridoxamine 5'-phosphate oxidase